MKDGRTFISGILIIMAYTIMPHYDLDFKVKVKISLRAEDIDKFVLNIKIGVSQNPVQYLTN